MPAPNESETPDWDRFVKDNHGKLQDEDDLEDFLKFMRSYADGDESDYDILQEGFDEWSDQKDEESDT